MSSLTLVSTKLKSILIKASSKSKKKSPLTKTIIRAHSYLINQYGSNCNNKYKYFYQVADNLLFNRNTHLVSVFKDNMIHDFIDEFLKKYYKKRESFKKIPQYTTFYTNYQRYFCLPTFRVKFYNKKLHQQREKKAKVFYNNKFKDKESSMDENNIGFGAVSVGGKPKGKIIVKNKGKKIDKTFFDKEVKKILEKSTVSNYNKTLSLRESGSKLKNNSSYLLNTTSNEESLCNIINGLYKKKLFDNYNNKRKNKTLSQKKNNKNNDTNNNSIKNNNILNKKNMNLNMNNNSIKYVLKKRVIKIKNKNRNNNTSNNNETSELNNAKIPNNLSANIINKIGTHNLKIYLNNKEYENTANNKKLRGRIGLWNAINEKENRHVKSQDNYIVRRTDNILTFHKNKKVNRNISFVSLYKKNSVPTSKGNISAKIKKNDYVQNQINNIFRNHNNNNDFSKNKNNTKDKINNIKKKSFRPIRLSKSNLNINNFDFKNQNESLLNKIKNKVYDIIQKKSCSKGKLQLIKTGEESRKYVGNINYNNFKKTPNGLSVFYQNLNTNKENNYLTNNYRRNNNKLDFKSTPNIFKSSKLSKSPSISEFLRYIRVQKNNLSTNKNSNKNSQRNYKTIEGKANNIQNLNININNQINIRLNNIDEIPEESINNKKNMNQKTKSRNNIKNIDYNTNQNYVIKYNNNIPTFFGDNNKRKKIRIFPNNNLLDNLKNKGKRNNNKFTYYKEKTGNNTNDKFIRKYNNLN